MLLLFSTFLFVFYEFLVGSPSVLPSFLSLRSLFITFQPHSVFSLFRFQFISQSRNTFHFTFFSFSSFFSSSPFLSVNFLSSSVTFSLTGQNMRAARSETWYFPSLLSLLFLFFALFPPWNLLISFPVFPERRNPRLWVLFSFSIVLVS